MSAVRLTALTAGLVILAGAPLACRYGGPLAGGASQIREGTLPERPARFLRESGGERSLSDLLPGVAADSAAIYLLAVDQRALGVANAQVAVLPQSDSAMQFPKSGWQRVDAHGVFARRFAPGEYVVFVQDPYHWAARHVIRLRSNSVDTLLAIMRSGVAAGEREVFGGPPNP